MGMVDTSVLIELVSSGREVVGDACMVSVIEYPTIMEYRKFKGSIIIPDIKDFELALDMQRRLRASGNSKQAADLLIAAVCLNNGKSLKTHDRDFEDIAAVSGLVLE